jgi:hypothetical protein
MSDPEGDTLAAALLAGDTETVRLRAALHRYVRGPKAPTGLRPLLVAQLDDLDGDVAGFAARALLRMQEAGEPEAAAVAERLMLGGSRIATLDRLAALGMRANAAGIPALFAYMGSEDSQIRRAAIESLAPKSGTFPGATFMRPSRDSRPSPPNRGNGRRAPSRHHDFRRLGSGDRASAAGRVENRDGSDGARSRLRGLRFRPSRTRPRIGLRRSRS